MRDWRLIAIARINSTSTADKGCALANATDSNAPSNTTLLASFCAQRMCAIESVKPSGAASSNPADSSRLLPMIKRIKECYGKLPRQVAADAGYASADNISEAKALGIKAVGLPKKRGMKVEDMTGSEWIYKKLKRFRAGIEGNISTLKRVFGLDRCTWRGLEHFKAYVMSAVLAYNFNVLARLSRQT